MRFGVAILRRFGYHFHGQRGVVDAGDRLSLLAVLLHGGVVAAMAMVFCSRFSTGSVEDLDFWRAVFGCLWVPKAQGPFDLLLRLNSVSAFLEPVLTTGELETVWSSAQQAWELV